MMRFGCLLLIVIIALGAYYVYDSRAKGSRIMDAALAIESARGHVENAQKLLAGHKLAAAKAELEAAMKCLKPLGETPVDMADRMAEFLGTSKEKAEEALKKAQDFVMEGSKKAKVK